LKLRDIKLIILPPKILYPVKKLKPQFGIMLSKYESVKNLYTLNEKSFKVKDEKIQS